MTAAVVQRAGLADEAQARSAGWLINSGLRPGDRLAISAPSSLDYLNVALGALRSGMIPVLINTSLLKDEVEYILSDARPAIVMGEHEVVAATKHHRRAALSRWPLGRPMAYTSGTTGQPKGVYSGVLSETEAQSLWAEEIDLWGITAADTYVQIGPLYHSAPLRFAACVQLAGGSVVVPGPFQAERTLKAILEHSPSVGFAAPIHLKRLFAVDPDDAWTDMRLLAHAGAVPTGGVCGSQATLWRRSGLGVLWQHRRSVHRVLAGRSAGCARVGWSSSTQPQAPAGRRRPHLVHRPARRRLHLLG